MAASDSQNFLRELDKKLWTAADRLLSNLDAAVYKHAVLGLIALAEGKSGGHWTGATKTSPQSRVYDSALGCGGFFVSSERFIEDYGGKFDGIPKFRRVISLNAEFLRKFSEYSPRSRKFELTFP